MRKRAAVITLLALGATAGAATACGSGAAGTTGGVESASAPVAGDLRQTGPSTIARQSRAYRTDFLLFSGQGAWAAEVGSLRQLFTKKGASFDEADTSDLNSISLEKLSQYGAIVWPGGVGAAAVSELTTPTKDKLRKAVQEIGVGWIGFCAGAFVAVAPPPAPGKDPEYGIGVVPGQVLGYYFLEEELEAAGQYDFAIVTHTLAKGQKRDLVWYGGPVTPETGAGVIARYPNGQPSISQLWSGNGFVILSAVHPAAPQYVRDTFGVTDADGTDFDLAWSMFEAVLKQKELPTI